MFDWFKRIARDQGPERRQERQSGKVETMTAQSPISIETDSRELLSAGNRWLDAGDLERAAQCYRKATVVAPSNALAFVNLGFVQCELRHFDAAHSSLAQAIVLSPGNWDAHYMLSRVEQVQGDLDAALKSLQTTLDLKADFFDALHDLCLLLATRGRAKEGLNLLEQRQGLGPESSRTRFLRGNLLIALDDLDGAEKEFRTAMQLAPDDPAIHVNLGVVLLRKSRHEDAMAFCQRALLSRAPTPSGTTIPG